MIARTLSVAPILVALSLVVSASAGEYPSRPVRLVVPYAAGGPVDIVGHIVAQRLTGLYHQQVIVDNRAGGGGNIALEIVAHAAPDSYTLLMAANGVIAINPGLCKTMPVDTGKDLAPVGTVASSAMILVVHPSVAANSVMELIALAKAKPGVLNMFTGISSTLSFVKSSRLKSLAVSSQKRLSLLPDLPTVAEMLPGYEVVTWYGVFAPAATPRAIVESLNAALVKIFATQDAQARLAALGADPHTDTPQQFARLVARETVKWARIVKDSGARAD